MTHYLFPCCICLISNGYSNHGEMELRKAKLGPPVHKVTGNSSGVQIFTEGPVPRSICFLRIQRVAIKEWNGKLGRCS